MRYSPGVQILEMGHFLLLRGTNVHVTINAQPQILYSSRLVYVGMWSPKSFAADPIEAISENPDKRRYFVNMRRLGDHAMTTRSFTKTTAQRFEVWGKEMLHMELASSKDHHKPHNIKPKLGKRVQRTD